MIIDRPPNPNGLCLVTDVRLKYDKDLQEEEGGSPVFREWGFGKAVLGRAWAGVTRIALYDYGADTEALTPEWVKELERLCVQYPKRKRSALEKQVLARQRERIRTELRAHLNEARYPCTIILQTRGAEQKNKEEFGDAKGLKGTTAWLAMPAPDSLPEMAGCVWESPYGPIMPMLNPINYEKVHGEAMRRQMKGALAICLGHAAVLRPPLIHYEDTEEARTALRRMRGFPIAVDIESYSTQDLITAIGISDGITSVSVPWDSFTPFGQSEPEPGATPDARALVEELLAADTPKIFHNYTYDVPFLERKGVPVGGVIHDTYAMHGVVYKQWRHGLQRACASELLIPPWKSIWHPKAPPAGLCKDDAEWWILEPLALRQYNAHDAFYTFCLYSALKWKVGL